MNELSRRREVQLRIEDVTEASQEDWREIHNRIIAASPIAPEEMPERRRRNLLTLAYAGDQLVGNSTLRPPTDKSDTATVIVRILLEHRNRGLGTSYLQQVLERARALFARIFEQLGRGAILDEVTGAPAGAGVDE